VSYQLKVMPMGAADDERSRVIQSQNGDAEAFAALVSTYQRMIHSLTYRMSGSLADAEDLAQETFIRAYQQLDEFQGKSKFSSWLYRIAINTCLNWQRHERRRSDLHTTWAESAQHTTDPTGDTIQTDLGRSAQDALLRLPAKQRAAIVLTVYDGLSHAEAAQALGCSETTVSWRLFAARSKLKRWLKPAARMPGR
jgi:RNA polymerase sigma-70 factor, ECF subfamily